MRIWALSDLHLSLGVDKPMDVFGEHWRDHHLKMAAAWDRMVAEEDIVVTPGDFSWASRLDKVAADMAWLGDRPGAKIMVKGNHDYWWPKSRVKMTATLPPRTWALKKNACIVDGVGFFGARGGDFAPLIRYGDERSQEDCDRALDKEEDELRRSLADLERQEAVAGEACRLRICCFHYPPIPPGRRTSRFTPIIQDGGASFCVYGHLHGADVGSARVEGEIDGVRYLCASCDLLDFTPTLLHEKT